MNPPNAAPNGKPQNSALVINDRLLSGQNSLINVTTLGNAAPKPSPVSRRKITSLSKLSTKAYRRQVKPKKHTEVPITIFRPYLSAIGPANSEPMDSPMSAALSTGASACLLIPHSCCNETARKPAAAVSKPSNNTMAKQITKITL